MRSNERECIIRWEHAFEADPAEKEKYYLTVAYPYPSGAMHVGHGRTYIVPDVIARYPADEGEAGPLPDGVPRHRNPGDRDTRSG